MSIVLATRRWAAEHKDEKGHWVRCDCGISRAGIIKSVLDHRIREMYLEDVEVTKKEWV